MASFQPFHRLRLSQVPKTLMDGGPDVAYGSNHVLPTLKCIESFWEPGPPQKTLSCCYHSLRLDLLKCARNHVFRHVSQAFQLRDNSSQPARSKISRLFLTATGRQSGLCSKLSLYGTLTILRQEGAFESRRGSACSCRGCQSKSQKLPCDSKATEPVDPSEPI